MNEQEQFWAGEHGAEYLRRNRVDWITRVPFWNMIMNRTEARSVLEVGCNAGWNLLAIRQAVGAAAAFVNVKGVDVNQDALDDARRSFLLVKHCSAKDVGTRYPQSAELVFTAGVLIHIAPADLEAAMRSIIAASNAWVLSIEYESPSEEEIVYRGQQNRLWKRPHGDLYQRLGLHRVASGFAGKDEGFDNCTWHLLLKYKPGEPQ